MYPSDNRMKGRKERDFFLFIFMTQARSLPPLFFTNRQMCSAKGNGLSDRRNRQKKKERNQEKKEKKNTPRPIKPI
jgi:hypothetical protein